MYAKTWLCVVLCCLGVAQAKMNITFSYLTDSTKAAPLLVRFKSTVTDAQNPQYFWDFGDGTTSTDPQPQHIFYKPATYLVQMTVKDQNGQKATAKMQLNVQGLGEMANIVLLPELDGRVQASMLGSRVYAPQAEVSWTLDEQRYQGQWQGVWYSPPPLAVGSHDLRLTLTTDTGRQLSKLLRFKIGVFSENSEQEALLLNQVNVLRASGWDCEQLATVAAPKAPLRRNPLLDRAARAHALMMAANGFQAHQSPIDGSMPSKRIEAVGYLLRENGVRNAENLARGFATATEVLDGWKNSLGHCENIMTQHLQDNADFVETGIALIEATAPDPYRYFWVQVFANPKE